VENLRGIVIMMAAMAFFSIEDMFIKQVAQAISTGQILAILAFVAVPIFEIMARLQGQTMLHSNFFHPGVLTRNGLEMIGTLGFVTAITQIPLTSATAIFQATPLAVTLGAALFLGETVRWRRWAAIGVGFCGVLVIIRPGFDGFDPKSLWAVLAVIGLSGRDLATRRLPKGISNAQLSAWGFVVVGVLGALLASVQSDWVMPSHQMTLWLAGASVCAVFGYWGITAAMRAGELSAIAPFRYVRLVFAIIIGTTVFSEKPDIPTYIGAGMIILSGIYAFWRAKRSQTKVFPILLKPVS
jgi:drug/metabolite transporter (DMT)-like permease